jgi:hypothetical protein
MNGSYRRSRWLNIGGLAFLLLLFISPSAFAECDLDEVVSYTLLASKYVAGYIEKGERKDDFEGCDFDRVIIFDDNTGVRCIGYSYSYSYRPKAYIFSDGVTMQMCVDGIFYPVAPLR